MMQHFIDFVRTPAGAIACMALAVVVIGLVVDYALAKHKRTARPAPTMNDAMREHRRRQNAEHDALDRDIGWN